ncbi:MAG: purine-nucleoside phosphorylase [Microscillaceae bacterium]|nr:purine-nucleoside phosphorylase [Microscillaceae bacterium]MDW8460266.1 purine-nucleoside phosphorylase [Cytophagales bacterium]
MLLAQIQETTAFIQQKTQNFQPEVGIILGTGLGGLIKEIEIAHMLEYQHIPNFPISTVESHSGKLIFGTMSGKKVVAMQGRFHYYEGYTMQQVTFPVRVMKFLGIKYLLVSNAAGGLNPSYQISDLMILNDHINLLPDNPLRGKNEDELGVRFPDMFETYHPELRKKALEIARKYQIRANEGVYVSVMGPNLETPAEYRFLRTIGADAVGMSTVPEAIVAVHMNLPVFAVSVITDLCYEGHLKKVSLADVIAAAQIAEPKLTLLMKELVASLN